MEAMATSKIVIGRREWEEKLKYAKIRKEDMNKLILNFFLIEGQTTAAATFKIESATELDIDSKRVVDRMVIKREVQSGNIEDGINKLNDLNPEILQQNLLLSFRLHQKWFIELALQGNLLEALKFANKIGPIMERDELFLARMRQELEETIYILINATPELTMNAVEQLSGPLPRIELARQVNLALLESQDYIPYEFQDLDMETTLKTLSLAQSLLKFDFDYPAVKTLTTPIVEEPAGISELTIH